MKRRTEQQQQKKVFRTLAPDCNYEDIQSCRLKKKWILGLSVLRHLLLDDMDHILLEINLLAINKGRLISRIFKNSKK